jgi:prepilin-type N-terminal cleavage/methylation domain-containing protein
MMRARQGFTLVEVAVSLAIGGIIMAGAVALLVQLRVLPAWSSTKLGLERELDVAASWLRMDATNAQSLLSMEAS